MARGAARRAVRDLHRIPDAGGPVEAGRTRPLDRRGAVDSGRRLLRPVRADRSSPLRAWTEALRRSVRSDHRDRHWIGSGGSRRSAGVPDERLWGVRRVEPRDARVYRRVARQPAPAAGLARSRRSCDSSRVRAAPLRLGEPLARRPSGGVDHPGGEPQSSGSPHSNVPPSHVSRAGRLPSSIQCGRPTDASFSTCSIGRRSNLIGFPSAPPIRAGRSGTSGRPSTLLGIAVSPDGRTIGYEVSAERRAGISTLVRSTAAPLRGRSGRAAARSGTSRSRLKAAGSCTSRTRSGGRKSMRSRSRVLANGSRSRRTAGPTHAGPETARFLSPAQRGPGRRRAPSGTHRVRCTTGVVHVSDHPRQHS